MNYLIYSFFITLTILIMKIKFSWIILIIFFLFFILMIKKSLKSALFLGVWAGLILNPNIQPQKFSNKVVGSIVEVRDNFFVVKTESDKILVWSKAKPKKNSVIRLIGNSAHFKSNGSDGEFFNERYFWNSKGISYKVLNPKFQQIIKSNEPNDYVYSWFKLVFKNQKDEKTDKIYKALQQLGLAHIIVISSFHLSFLFYLLIWFKKPIRLMVLTLFCWYIGFPISAQKALIFLFVVTFAQNISKLTSLAISGYIMLLLQPFIASNGSFILTMVFSSVILLFCTNTNKWEKLLSLRLISFYITWLWTSSIYLLNFITIFLSPVIFIIYAGVLLRIEWLLRFIEYSFINLNKINFPIVIGQNILMQITLLIILILLIRNIVLFHKAAQYIWYKLILLLIIFKIYFINLSFVAFLSVGQGDAAIIKIKHKTYLIDVGKKGQFQKVIKPYLLRHGINRLDYIYISHDHFDHSGGLKDDFGWIKVKDKPNPNIVNLNDLKWGNENDNSQVLLFQHKNKSFLFTGDISKKVENYISGKINKKVDFLKVSHHGSNASTSKYFITTIKPIKAIISYGNNNYGHPHQEVLDILKENNVIIHETKKSGHLKIML